MSCVSPSATRRLPCDQQPDCRRQIPHPPADAVPNSMPQSAIGPSLAKPDGPSVPALVVVILASWRLSVSCPSFIIWLNCTVLQFTAHGDCWDEQKHKQGKGLKRVVWLMIGCLLRSHEVNHQTKLVVAMPAMTHVSDAIGANFPAAFMPQAFHRLQPEDQGRVQRLRANPVPRNCIGWVHGLYKVLVRVRVRVPDEEGRENDGGGGLKHGGSESP